MIKTCGEKLIKGQGIVSISLPVRIFEPRSTLERICDNWAFLPIYLKKASQTKVKIITTKIFIKLLKFLQSILFEGSSWKI